MQNILVPCDFSASAFQGLHFAVELAAANAASLHIISVISPQQLENDPLIAARYGKHFEDFREEIMLSVFVKHEIRIGKLLPSVMKFVQEKAVDLIVVGSRGSRGWEGIFIGSNVEKIVRTASVPVFAVKRETHFRNIKNIVFPCDLLLSEHDAIEQLKAFQTLSGARLHLLRVDTESDIANRSALINRIREYADFHELSAYTINIVEDEDEKDGILGFAKEMHADMIAMTTQGADLSHLYRASIAADVVNHANLLTWTCLQQG